MDGFKNGEQERVRTEEFPAAKICSKIFCKPRLEISAIFSKTYITPK